MGGEKAIRRGGGESYTEGRGESYTEGGKPHHCKLDLPDVGVKVVVSASLTCNPVASKLAGSTYTPKLTGMAPPNTGFDMTRVNCSSSCHKTVTALFYCSFVQNLDSFHMNVCLFRRSIVMLTICATK